MKRFVLLLVLLPFELFAQVKITGRVVNEIDNTPLVSASVFLSNATVGDKTDEQGRFTLNNVKSGQYDLVVTIVGFEGYKKTILITNEPVNLGDVKLLPITIALSEVKIRPNFNREKYFNEFKKEFLGTSDLARQTTIINPDVVNIDYDPEAKMLTADSGPDYIELENKALGYNVKYYLKTCIVNYKNRRVFYEGTALYEEMEGTPRQQSKWRKKRNAVYKGSPMQFFRDLVANKLNDDFIIVRSDRRLKPGQKIYVVAQDTVSAYTFAKRTKMPGIYMLNNNFPLYIWYAAVTFDKNGAPVWREPGENVGKIELLQPNAFFDDNGVLLNPESVLFNYRWGTLRVGDQLPIDFVPTEEK